MASIRGAVVATAVALVLVGLVTPVKAATITLTRNPYLTDATAYCYAITDGSTSALAPIPFRTLPAPGGTSDFSFDVIRVNGWSTTGQSEPTFPVLGNHGRTATFLQNWPTSDAVAAPGGQYAMVTYPGQDGATTTDYPTAYYAFDVGQARFYVLDADWTDANVGTSTLYRQDYLNHWAPGDAEYEWLKADLAAHPGAAASVASLALRVYATVGLVSGGIQVRPEPDTWTETETTRSTPPAPLAVSSTARHRGGADRSSL